MRRPALWLGIASGCGSLDRVIGSGGVDAGPWLERDGDRTPEGGEGWRFWECPEGWNATEGFSGGLCRCTVGAGATAEGGRVGEKW